MQLIGSIIFTCAPFHYGCLLAARYVAGAGIGLITVPFLIHSAEVASDNHRGVSGSMEQCGLALGIAIQVTIIKCSKILSKNISSDPLGYLRHPMGR